MSNRPLTLKQQRFVENYVATGKARDSAIVAGYSEASAALIANENLNKPYIQQSIQERNREIMQKAGLDLNYRAKKLQEILDQGLETNQLTAALNAIDVMNKITGDYAPTQTENTNKNLNVNADIQRAKDLVNKYKQDK